MTDIDMDEMIEKMFPLSLLNDITRYEDADWIADMIYDAYAQGFKDGYAKRNPDATIKLTFVDSRKRLMEKLKAGRKGENNA
jgi:hypothetical protein